MNRPTFTVPAKLNPVQLQNRFRTVIPKLIVASMIAAAVTTVWTVHAFGWQRGLGVGMLLTGVTLAPREWRINQFVSAAFYLIDPVMHFEMWESYRRQRWRSKLQQAGFARDFSYKQGTLTAARKPKWVKLKIVPWYKLWPDPEDVRAIQVRLTPRQTIDEVEAELTKKIAFFFQLPVEHLAVTKRPRWMSSTITFTRDVTGPILPGPFRLEDDHGR